jgi:hypothetical protein
LAPGASQADAGANAAVDYRPLDQHDRHPVDPYKASQINAAIDYRPLDQHDRHPVDPYKVSGTSSVTDERQARWMTSETKNSTACLAFSAKFEQARCLGVK